MNDKWSLIQSCNLETKVRVSRAVETGFNVLVLAQDQTQDLIR